MFPMAFVMEGCREAMLTARGRGMSGRLPQAGAKMSRHRGRWRDPLPLGLRFSVLGGASPRGSLMKVASSCILVHE